MSVQIIPAIREDGSLYRIEKMEAHRQGALHLAISVFIFDGEEMLVQRRAESKYHCGGMWANACCSHPHWEESAEDAAARRIGEELGCALPLRRMGETTYRADVGGGLWEHERVTMFRGDVARDALTLDLNPDEVSAVRWASVDALRAEMASDPDSIAPWFRIYLERWDGLGLEDRPPVRGAA
jgi:isopentenyl-diphosphate delta-isomerase